jgi:hypothetical protein
VNIGANCLKDDEMFHYDRTLIRQISYGFISTFSDAEAENYRKNLTIEKSGNSIIAWIQLLSATTGE